MYQEQKQPTELERICYAHYVQDKQWNLVHARRTTSGWNLTSIELKYSLPFPFSHLSGSVLSNIFSQTCWILRSAMSKVLLFRQSCFPEKVKVLKLSGLNQLRRFCNKTSICNFTGRSLFKVGSIISSKSDEIWHQISWQYLGIFITIIMTQFDAI